MRKIRNIFMLLIAAAVLIKGGGNYAGWGNDLESLAKKAETFIEQPFSAEANNSELSSGVEEAVIEKISDGDTIKVRIGEPLQESGDDTTAYQTEKVRFLEIDTPESVNPDETKNTEYGKLASEYTKSILSEGQTVYLTRDESDRDRYGRLLRIVWLEAPENPMDEEELRNKCLNAKLLLDGYAKVAIYDDDAYEHIFRTFEQEARDNQRGLWGMGWK